jgi:hypothetical protein
MAAVAVERRTVGEVPMDEEIGHLFEGCGSCKIPYGVTSIGESPPLLSHGADGGLPCNDSLKSG